MRFNFTADNNNTQFNLTKGFLVLDWAKVKYNHPDNLELIVIIEDSQHIKEERFFIKDFDISINPHLDYTINFLKKVHNKCWINIPYSSTINFYFKGIQNQIIELSIFVIK